MSEEQTERNTAIHEAAHAVIGYRTYGGSVHAEGVTIIPKGEIAGSAESMQMHDGLEEGFILALLAGWIAQSRINPRIRARGCSDDFQQVREFLPYAEITLSQAIAKTRELVSKHWKEIEAVAEELEKHSKLDDVEVSIIADSAIGYVVDGDPVTRDTLGYYRNRRDVSASTLPPG